MCVCVCARSKGKVQRSPATCGGVCQVSARAAEERRYFRSRWSIAEIRQDIDFFFFFKASVKIRGRVLQGLLMEVFRVFKRVTARDGRPCCKGFFE